MSMSNFFSELAIERFQLIVTMYYQTYTQTNHARKSNRRKKKRHRMKTKKTSH